MNIRSILASAALAAASMSYAQTHTDSFVYQGELMDMGAPADGMYDFSFIVYDSEVGGNVVFGGAQSVSNVQVTNGRFETVVNFGVTGTVFDSDQVRWLNIAVRPTGAGSYTQIPPRQRITPAPLANYALRSGTDLQAAYDNGNDIFFSQEGGGIELHSDVNQKAVVRINNSDGDARALFFESGFGSGDVALYGNTNNIISRLYTDTSAGGGGYLYIARNDSGVGGVVLEGNSAGTESAIVSIFGETESIFLNTRSSGNSSVAIPNNAIEALEIYNEAGVAETETTSSVVLTPEFAVNDTIDTVTVTAPTDGYVLVIATAEVSINHITTSTTNANFGVSMNTFLPANGDVELRIGGELPTATYDYPVTVQAIFQASQGANTYYFIGDQNTTSGNITVLDRQVSAIFVPTAYGSVARDSGINLPDDQAPITAPRTQLEILQEQNAALQADTQRQQRELEEIRVMMDQLKQQLDHNNQQNPQHISKD
tara:strand:- start:53 stop:1507 length:1455 start_codon:yes stop_codon:yes gene_type:complete